MAEFIRLSGLDQVPEALKGAAVAIGNFDGFHRGHQRVFAALKDRARRAGRPAVVLTFEPHPRDVFAPAPFLFRLTDAAAKARLAEALGLDGIVVMPFNRAFSQIEAEDFVSRFLIEALAVTSVVIGADFHFGRGRRGTPDFLRASGATHGFDVEVLDMLQDGGAPISSSYIREQLESWRLEEANRCLGYHWFLEGEVVTGDQRGRELGYPTANLDTEVGFGLTQGVYAVRGLLDGRVLNGVASYGKPMFNNHRPPFETFFFDFSEDIYGRHLAVALVALIRGQKIFSGLDELIQAMAADSTQARQVLAAAKPISELDGKLGFFP